MVDLIVRLTISGDPVVLMNVSVREHRGWINGENCVFRRLLEFVHVYEVAVVENRPLSVSKASVPQ